VHKVGGTFTDSGVTITVLPFEWDWMGGTWTHNGFVKVGNAGAAGGSGQEIEVNTVNLGFDISGLLKGLSHSASMAATSTLTSTATSKTLKTLST
jgi:hypothetical protein